jgi:hypothetical protein
MQNIMYLILKYINEASGVNFAHRYEKKNVGFE